MKYKKNNLNSKFWLRAQKVIAGGNMLFSKRPDNLLPENWPTYFKKSKDAYVWDLNNKKFLDMLFLVGTNVLGYANKEIDDYVKKIITKGIMTSLN